MSYAKYLRSRGLPQQPNHPANLRCGGPPPPTPPSLTANPPPAATTALAQTAHAAPEELSSRGLPMRMPPQASTSASEPGPETGPETEPDTRRLAIDLLPHLEATAQTAPARRPTTPERNTSPVLVPTRHSANGDTRLRLHAGGAAEPEPEPEPASESLAVWDAAQAAVISSPRHSVPLELATGKQVRVRRLILWVCLCSRSPTTILGAASWWMWLQQQNNWCSERSASPITLVVQVGAASSS